MGQKIKLSSNIPIVLPENLSDKQFSLGFLYPCNSGQGLQVQPGQTWFEKICLSLNKINSIVGFQNSNLKIPEYIAETISVMEKNLDNTHLLVRYNAQTKINDFISTFAPENMKVSFNDQVAKSLTKGTPMVILGEKKLKNMFFKFEEMFGLETKVKFVVNHEIAHNIDCSRNYKRGDYSLKNILENHLGTRLSANSPSPFQSTTELEQTKKMIKQLWTLSLEHYADTLGFLNLRNEFLNEGVSSTDIKKMLDILIEERQNNFKENTIDFINKYNQQHIVDFEDKYKCINHFTVNALIKLKETLKDLGDKKLSISNIEKITVDIVNQSDLKVLYILSKLDKKSAQLLDNVFHSEPNAQCILGKCESKKPEFESKIKNLLGIEWVKELDKFIISNKETMTLFNSIDCIFTHTTEQLKELNKNHFTHKVKQVRAINQKITNSKIKGIS